MITLPADALSDDLDQLTDEPVTSPRAYLPAKEPTIMGEPIEQAFTVTAEGGEVMVDGEGVALSMTVEAAQELADQLCAAVSVALAQRVAGPKVGVVLSADAASPSNIYNSV